MGWAVTTSISIAITSGYDRDDLGCSSLVDGSFVGLRVASATKAHADDCWLFAIFHDPIDSIDDPVC
jgi:hypothetical protein